MRRVRLSRQAYRISIYHHRTPAWLVEIHGAQLGTNTRLVGRYAIPSRYFHNIGRYAGEKNRTQKDARGARNICAEKPRTRLEFNIWCRRNTKILHTKYREENRPLPSSIYAHCISRCSIPPCLSIFFLSLSSTERGSAEAPPLRSWFTSLCEGCHRARVSSSGGHTTLPTTDGTSEIADNE